MKLFAGAMIMALILSVNAQAQESTLASLIDTFCSKTDADPVRGEAAVRAAGFQLAMPDAVAGSGVAPAGAADAKVFVRQAGGRTQMVSFYRAPFDSLPGVTADMCGVTSAPGAQDDLDGLDKWLGVDPGERGTPTIYIYSQNATTRSALPDSSTIAETMDKVRAGTLRMVISGLKPGYTLVLLARPRI